MRFIFLFCVIIVITIGFFLQKKNNENQKFYKEAIELKLKNLEHLKSRLLGEELNEVSVILKDSLCPDVCNRTIVYYYTGNDCLQCIQKGFRILKNINGSFSKNLIWVISSNTNIYRDQMANEYHDYVYSDENEMIRRKLKNFYSPVFFVLSNNKIEEIHFISSNDGICDEDIVIMSIKKQIKKDLKNVDRDGLKPL